MPLYLVKTASSFLEILSKPPPPDLSYQTELRETCALQLAKMLCKKLGGADAEQVDVLEQEMLVQKSLGRDASWVAPGGMLKENVGCRSSSLMHRSCRS